MSTNSTLTQFGVTTEHLGSDQRCIAFDADGVRCDRAAAYDSSFCPDCSEGDGVAFTLDDLPLDTWPAGVSGTSVRDLLRDKYGFAPREAILYSRLGGSVVAVARSIEGKLARTILEDGYEPTVCHVDVSPSGLREKHDRMRRTALEAASESFISNWRDTCHVVTSYWTRCGHQPASGRVCDYHRRRGYDDRPLVTGTVLEDAGFDPFV